MNGQQRAELEQELLELYFDCHPQPESLRKRIEDEPDLAAIYADVCSRANLLEQAARVDSEPFEPRPPRPWIVRRLPFLPIAAAAAACAIALLNWGIATWRHRQLCKNSISIAVEARTAVPDGMPISVAVSSFDFNGEPANQPILYAFLDSDGVPVSKGRATADGPALVLRPQLPSARRFVVYADTPTGERKVEIPLRPSNAAPLTHIETDKPIYRPGESVRFRAVVLDRLTLRPTARANSLSLRVLDTQGAVIKSLEHEGVFSEHSHGVAWGTWSIPEGAAGGRYTIQVHDNNARVPEVDHAFVVRRFEPPRLAKEITLDRESYGPGDAGVAEVRVNRLAGGVAAGAKVRAALVLDGNEVWTESGELDRNGHALFTFVVPSEVERGEARFVASVVDGGTRETAVEPFVVPTGRLELHAYPEGGDLVADLPNRIYIEVTDQLGRPVSASGQVVDSDGAPVATFRTEHAGRTRIEIQPRSDASYACELRTPSVARIELPKVKQTGVILRSLQDVTPGGEPVRVRVSATVEGSRSVAAFCRGMCVATASVEGIGTHDVELAVPDALFGVIRITVFNDQLEPRAERLVQRLPGQRIRLAVEPENAVIEPGGKQSVTITATDETGSPVAAALGVGVTDRALRTLTTEPRAGLLDRVALLGDVTVQKDLADYLPDAAHAPRNVDLLLGTRGWRRFVWSRDPEATGDEVLDRVRPLEGFARSIESHESRADNHADVAASSQRARSSQRATEATLLLSALGLLLYGFVLGARWIGRRLRWTSSWRGDLLAATAGAGVLFMGLFALNGSTLRDAAPEGQVLLAIGGRDGMFVREEVEEFEDAAWFAEIEPQLKLDIPDADLARNGNDVVFEDTEIEDAKVEAQAGEEIEGLVAGHGFFEHTDYYRYRQRAQREYAHRHHGTGERTDFTDSLFWDALLVLDANGRGRIEFDASDRVTTWGIDVSAHGGGGRVGQASAEFDSRLPFFFDVQLPVELTAGDRVDIPIAITAEGNKLDEAEIKFTPHGSIAAAGPTLQSTRLNDGRGRVLAPLVVGEVRPGETGLDVLGVAGRFRDQVRKPIRVVPRGFPHAQSWAGTLSDEPAEVVVTLPRKLRPGSARATLKIFPSPLANLREGLEGLLQEPCGCFEQASSSNYPNTMVLSYALASGDNIPSVVARAEELLPSGYAKIAGYECDRRGYEWFGSDPGHEALTAYGLMEFADMRVVHEVDAEMVERTRSWLLGRRDGAGGFARDPNALDSFGAAPALVTDAYITYALLYSGEPAAELTAELDRLAQRATTTNDAYELALAACALGHTERQQAATAARARLESMQRQDGSLLGSTTSITASGKRDLAVETTSFAILAWLDGKGAHAAKIRQACDFLQSQQTARGTFGATQATIMALKALTANAQSARRAPANGTIAVFAGERRIAVRAFSSRDADPITFDLTPFLNAGANTLRLELAASEEDFAVSWACDLEYHADQPADDPEAALSIRTELTEQQVAEGRTVAIRVAVRNLTAKGQPMGIANIGIPAGLHVPTNVLDALLEAGAFDLWEVRGRTLTFYWRAFEPNAVREFNIDCVARIPGTTTGPASNAYLYYTPNAKRWSEGVRVEVR